MTDEKGKWQAWAEQCHADIELLRAVKQKGLTLKEIEDYSRISAETDMQYYETMVDDAVKAIVTKFEE